MIFSIHTCIRVFYESIVFIRVLNEFKYDKTKK